MTFFEICKKLPILAKTQRCRERILGLQEAGRTTAAEFRRKEVMNLDGATVEGVVEVDFKNDTGETISGKTVYYTEPLDPERGEGRFAGKIFFSAAKLAAFDYSPAVGQVVQFFYDRGGKVKAVTVVDDDPII